MNISLSSAMVKLRRTAGSISARENMSDAKLAQTSSSGELSAQTTAFFRLRS